jgi:hypothetical protein
MVCRPAPWPALLVGVGVLALSERPALGSPDFDPCVRELVVGGDPALVQEVQQRLQERGLFAADHTGCGALLVQVSAEGGKVRVVIRDTEGNADDRVVGDATTAAVFVESRARSALAAPSPVAPSSAGPSSAGPSSAGSSSAGQSPAAQSSAAPSSAAQPAPVGAPQVEAERAGSALRGTMGFMQGASAGSEGSTWIDSTVHACVRLGPFCVGGQLRGSFDPGLTGRSAELASRRAALDAEVIGTLPLGGAGRLRLTPGLGLGSGWLRSSRAEPRPGLDDERSAANFGGLRLEGFLRASYPIAEGFRLGLAGFALVDPFAQPTDTRDPDAPLAGTPVLRAGGALELSYGEP